MNKAKTITIQANGEKFRGIPAECSLLEFLAARQLSPGRVVVERNGEALTPAETRETILEDGDRLEIVRIVAGG